MKAKEKQG